jgi:hypothetical protein
MDLQQFNLEVAEWSKVSLRDLRAELTRLNVKYSSNSNSLSKVLRSSVRKSRGMASRISFNMPRHAIFLHKGVGQGRPANRPKGAKPWFNPVIDRNMPDLADKVANGQADLIVNTLNIQ